MDMSENGRMQQFIVSKSRAGKNLKSGDPVLIKIYINSGMADRRKDQAIAKSFQTQVAILQKLQEPFSTTDATQHHPRLAYVAPSELFIKLVDFSKDFQDRPGANPMDTYMFIVTELPTYSLKEYIRDVHR